MGDQPFYHTRPNKYVDRQIFTQILKSLNRQLDISKYTYVGMGSYMFDDFKLIHNEVCISKMISLEKDLQTFKRATFNKPLKCISLLQMSTSEYIASLEPGQDHYIVWLDFTEPRQLGCQFNDFCRLISKLNEHDVVRITLNANPTSLGKPQNDDISLWDYRLSVLKDRLGDFVPATVGSDDLIKARYPLVLLSCLEKAQFDTLQDQSKYFLPLSASIYDDNTQMLTLTGVILKNAENISLYKRNTDLKRFCNFKWDNPLLICMPPLTPKEILHINNELPVKTHGKLIKKKYSFIFEGNEVGLNSYLRYYKEYPHFHSVSF